MAEEMKISDDDKMYCESIGKSISEIIRFSLDEEFRKRCFELLGVFGSKQAEMEISNRLMSLIEKENSSVNEGPKFKEKEKENSRVCNDFPEESQCEQSPNKNCVVEKPLAKKSWLEISSQQFRNVVKRRKLQYYSQPPFMESSQRNFEHSSSKLYFSNSQPTFECSSSAFNDTKEWKLPENGNKMSEDKFEETFDFHKYFK